MNETQIAQLYELVEKISTELKQAADYAARSGHDITGIINQLEGIWADIGGDADE